jgi:hypothetical protein
VRYTANSFPEDLAFTQTKDRQNWQTRYVIQQPYDGSVAQCSAKVAQMDCEAMCKPRVSEVLRWLGSPTSSSAATYPDPNSPKYSKDPSILQNDCLNACTQAKQNGLDAAGRYYQQDLPRRLSTEKQTLAQLTGWGLAQIDAMPGADKYSALSPKAPTPQPTTQPPAQPEPTWWEQLFNGYKSKK